MTQISADSRERKGGEIPPIPSVICGNLRPLRTSLVSHRHFCQRSIDSQSAKTTSRGGIHGYDGGKKVGGRKRRLLVDSSGLVLCVQVHAADIANPDGARPLLEAAAARFAKLGHLWADAGYRGELVAWIKEHLGWSVEVVQKPRRWVWCPVDEEPPPIQAFTVLKRRWVVERTFAWLGNYRRLSKDYEFLPATEENMIYLAMSRLILKRLCHPAR